MIFPFTPYTHPTLPKKYKGNLNIIYSLIRFCMVSIINILKFKKLNYIYIHVKLISKNNNIIIKILRHKLHSKNK